MPLTRLVNQSSLMQRSEGKRLAAGVRVTVTELVPPGATAPWLEETLSQAAVVPRDQLTVAVPLLVRVKVWVEMLNGPPEGPLPTGPRPGVTRKPPG